ncbi:MAG: Flagellar biosynthetic protein FlhB [Candidatus Dichloromethanomonas elyunquensis]|nr:MAG: Flagellar biosynthetic protein FlhB [Candidatus Dichloromethanomonas elyunquensis]
MKDDKSTKKMAAAIAYDHIGVPKVVAKGDGLVAQKIIEFAQEKRIPIQNNETLVEALMQVELAGEIPPELYQAVAEILAFIYRMDKQKAKSIR